MYRSISRQIKRKNHSIGALPRKFLWGGYVNLGPFILDNIRTIFDSTKTVAEYW